MLDITLTVAGEAGQGVKSGSAILAKAMSRLGYRVFACPDVMSRIRGGHNFTRIRVSDRPVNSIAPQHNVVLALDELSVKEHRTRTVDGGVIVSDGSETPTWLGKVRRLPIPMTELAKKHGGVEMAAVAGLGALFALTGSPPAGLEAVLKETFHAKGNKVVGANVETARAGHRVATTRPVKDAACRIPALEEPQRRMLLTGNQATALGALAAGVKLFAGYPMSPATGIMEYLASKQERFGLVVEQVEDEISAINTVIGASYAGVRAMTATSGGGFALMVEGLGLAAMAEIPVVIVVAQRPGPATGFPTRTEQAELLLAASASQDEFPRFVFAPGDAEQAFYATARAVELAGRYQVPAIVLTDQQVADSSWTVEELDFGRVGRPDDLADAEFRGLPGYTYRRYRDTASGVSPRLAPGFAEQLVCSMGSEHDEAGLPTEDADNRVKMQAKRMRKLDGMRSDSGAVTAYPGDVEDCVVACFGSTHGAVREAVELLQAEGRRVGMLHIGEPVPFPRAAVLARLSRARQLVVVEQDSTGQLAKLIRRETRRAPDEQILKYDGRPFSGQELAGRLRDSYHGRLT